MSEFKVTIIDDNTGCIVKDISDIREMSIFDLAKQYISKDMTVLVKKGNDGYCLYHKGDFYTLSTYTADRTELIEFFNDVLDGLYDVSRDGFHIQYGRVVTLCQFSSSDYSEYDFVLNCIVDIWERRYYSRER